MMRGAVCKLIERTAQVALPLPIKTLKLLEGSILDNLQHPTPDIQVGYWNTPSLCPTHFLTQNAHPK